MLAQKFCQICRYLLPSFRMVPFTGLGSAILVSREEFFTSSGSSVFSKNVTSSNHYTRECYGCTTDETDWPVVM